MIKRFLSNSGSALLPVMIAVLILGIIAGSVAQLATSGAQQAKSGSDIKSMLSLVQTLETVANTNEACMGVGSLDGLKFKNGAGPYNRNNFNAATAADAVNGQDISLGTQLQDAVGTPFVAKAGATYAPLKLTVDKLAFRGVTNTSGTTYQGEVVLQTTVNAGGADAHGLAPRVIGKLSITTNVAGNLQNCSYVQSAQLACQAMSCVFNSTAPQKCVCGFPALSCRSPAGQPQRYVSGVNYSTNPPTAICSDPTVDCTDTARGGKGPGFFFTGFDSNSDPMCVPVEGYAAGATPVTCTAGATTTVTANAATPAGCYCGAAQTWNGSSCVAGAMPVAGLCNASGTYADAAAVNTAGLCSAGTASPPSVSGAAPWSWSCAGSNGGTTALCSASMSAPICGPAGWSINTLCSVPPAGPIAITTNMDAGTNDWNVMLANCKTICDSTPGAVCCSLQDVTGAPGPGGGPGVRCRVYGAGSVESPISSGFSAMCR